MAPILVVLCWCSQDFLDPLGPLQFEKPVCSASISPLFQVSLFARLRVNLLVFARSSTRVDLAQYRRLYSSKQISNRNSCQNVFRIFCFCLLLHDCHSCLFSFVPIFIHRMSDGFRNDLPVMHAQGQPRATADTPAKRKGGRSKEKDLARGIPQSVIDKFNLSTPDHETEQQRKRCIQVIGRFWAIRW